MKDEKDSLLKKSFKRKSRKKYISMNEEEKIFDTETVNWQKKLRLILFVIFACLLSITVAAKIRFTPVTSHALSVHFNNRFPQVQMEWVGRLYAIIVLCMLPVVTGIIDYYKIGYRFALCISGLMHMIACITNSTVVHPLFFVLTDSFICGFGSSISFAVFLLAVDDIFPKGNRFRVTATTLCQGSTIGSLFILDVFALLAKHLGWMMFQLCLAGLFSVEAAMLILTCPEHGLKIRVKQRGGIKGLNELTVPLENSKPKELEKPNKLLGLTFAEMNKSPSMFPWLVYRFSMTIIHQGVFTLVLMDSHLVTIPDIDILLRKYYGTTLAALLYASGESLMYISGAISGQYLLGYLLHISIGFLCLLFLVSVTWQPVRLQMAQSMMIGNAICACLTGVCIGALGTCMIAASEEATMIPGRRIFPFVKLIEGLALTFCPFLFQILNKATDQNIWLLTFAVITAANACLLVYILHKLYAKYLENTTDHKAAMQISMRPVAFISRGLNNS